MFFYEKFYLCNVLDEGYKILNIRIATINNMYVESASHSTLLDAKRIFRFNHILE